jgi:dTDP-4-amino-4,6-dideoxygalactose transaminase
MREEMIPLFDLNYDDSEVRAVESVLRSKWISMGEQVNKFENDFAQLSGVHYAVAVTNCTAALHLSLCCLGLGYDDEVIVPSLTFVATVNAVRFVGATPVFADISSYRNWTVSPEDIDSKISNKTKAVIVMHYGGFGCEMDEILEIADERGLYVIEDASHGPGGIYRGKRLGSFGDLSCFSFYSNKNIATGEGGMILANRAEYAELAKRLRSHGMTSTSFERRKGAEFYDVREHGYNYRMDDIRGALGLVQLKKLENDIRRRNQLAKRYRDNIMGLEDVSVPFENYEGISTYYIFPILVHRNQRDALREELRMRGVQTSVHYPPVHLFANYNQCGVSLPKTEYVCEHTLSLPMFFSLTEEQVDYVCESLESSLKSLK